MSPVTTDKSGPVVNHHDRPIRPWSMGRQGQRPPGCSSHQRQFAVPRMKSAMSMSLPLATAWFIKADGFSDRATVGK